MQVQFFKTCIQYLILNYEESYYVCWYSSPLSSPLCVVDVVVVERAISEDIDIDLFLGGRLAKVSALTTALNLGLK